MHEEQPKRPLGDNELQAVVGGAATDTGALGQTLTGIYELRSTVFPDIVMSFDADEARRAWAGSANAVALNTGLDGLRGLLDAFTDDQGNVDPGATISLDQARAGFAGLDDFLGRSGFGALDSDHSGGISASDVTTMIAAVEGELDASENAWLQGLMVMNEVRLKTSEIDRSKVEAIRSISRNI